jgi:hypothetical protein
VPTNKHHFEIHSHVHISFYLLSQKPLSQKTKTMQLHNLCIVLPQNSGELMNQQPQKSFKQKSFKFS